MTVPVPFRRGKMQLGVGLSGSQGIIVLSARFGYFVLDGLMLSADFTQWFATPSMTDIAPEVRYVFWMVPGVQPYIAVYYEHAFVWSRHYPDADYVGGRLGLYWIASSGVVLAGGMAYQHLLSACSRCTRDEFYPELTLGLSF